MIAVHLPPTVRSLAEGSRVHVPDRPVRALTWQFAVVDGATATLARHGARRRFGLVVAGMRVLSSSANGGFRVIDEAGRVVIRRFGMWAFGLLVLAAGASVLIALVTAPVLRPDAAPGLGPAVRVSPTAPVSAQRDSVTTSPTPGHSHGECDGAGRVNPATPPSAGDDEDDRGDADD